MKIDWPGRLVTIADVQDRSMKEVLMEYDGPHLAVFADKQRHFLGLRIDDDEQHIAWLEAPLSGLEEEALKLGELTVRNALVKDQMWLVHVSHIGTPSFAQEVTASEVPQDILPEINALLPRYVRSRHRREAAERPEFRIDTKNGKVSLGNLGPLATSIQKVWDAFAPEFNAASAPLNAIGGDSGSFRIYLLIPA